MHSSAYQDAERFAKKYLNPESVLLIADIGSMDINGCLKPIFDKPPNWRYHGFDLEPGPNVDHVLPSLYEWHGFMSNFYDCVLATQVIEHVAQPWTWFAEVVRFTKPGGLIYICSPNTWPFHEHPIDCWRVWPDGLRGLFEWAGAECVEAYKNGPDTTGIAMKPQT